MTTANMLLYVSCLILNWSISMGLNIIYYSLFLNDYIDDKSKVQYTIIIKPQLKA